MGIWDIYARFYDSLPKYYHPYQKLVSDVVQTLENSIPRGSKILDAGCGTGNFSIELGRKGYNVEGIDFSKAMLERAKNKSKNEGLKNIEFKEWDIEKGITFHDDETLDCVLSVHTLYSLLRPELAIGEYSRILKPGGVLILVEPQHKIRIASFIKDAYISGGLYNVSRLVFTQLGISLFNIYIRRNIKKGIYHYWDQDQMRRELESFLARIIGMVPAYAADSDLMTVAVKPSFYFEANGYKFMTAETLEDLEKVCKLRYQVYCVERGYEPQNTSEIETDEYDDYATHFLAIDHNNKPVGTLRAIQENPKGYPMDTDFPLTEYIRERGISRAVEISRFTIDKDVEPKYRREIAFGLFKCLYDYCDTTGTRDIFSTTQPKVIEKYIMPGITQIGEPFEYSRPLSGGIWVPIHCDIHKTYNNYLEDFTR